jgi:hypothetical protein
VTEEQFWGRSRRDPYDATYCGKAIKDMTREELMDALVERAQAFDALLNAHSKEWDLMQRLRNR